MTTTPDPTPYLPPDLEEGPPWRLSPGGGINFTRPFWALTPGLALDLAGFIAEHQPQIRAQAQADAQRHSLQRATTTARWLIDQGLHQYLSIDISAAGEATVTGSGTLCQVEDLIATQSLEDADPPPRTGDDMTWTAFHPDTGTRIRVIPRGMEW